MPRQIINTGGAGNDGTGDTLRTTAEKVNDNFEELYRLSANGGLRVELYKAFNDPTLPESEDISLPTIYDFSGNDITMPEDPTLQGWKLSIPTEGRYVFLIQTSVPKADGVSQKTILPEEWTAPALIYDRGYEDLNVAITAVNGTVFLNDSGETELQARISINVSHIDGTIVTVGDDGTCPIGFGIPAESTAQEFSNGELKSIFIEAKAVPNSGTLPIQLTINDKEEG